MKREHLVALRLGGYAPRTLLDVGANIGGFAQRFLRIFPECVPTLIEPNPFCVEELQKLPFERHAFAASADPGRASLHLSKQWLQSTGASLYRENTDYFRDDLLLVQEVDKARIDDAFAGRRFDFVKIDTQGSELDVLRGGQEVLRQADFILLEVSLLEFNLGAPRPELLFEQLASMGFRPADVFDFHRMEDIRHDQLLQMDFLFERQVRRPSQSSRYAPLNEHADLLEHLQAQKARCPDFSVVSVGPAGWASEVAEPLPITSDIGEPSSWEPVLRRVASQGRFSYAVCTHALPPLAEPATVLRMLPLIAEAGFICTPSRYLECLRREGPYRGFLHHRWVLDPLDGQLMLAPKIPMLEHLAMAGEGGWASAPERFELQVCWRGGIAFSVLGGDRLGSGRDSAVDLFSGFFDRP
jgi:FkbM family methyltransferase